MVEYPAGRIEATTNMHTLHILFRTQETAFTPIRTSIKISIIIPNTLFNSVGFY